MLRYKRMPKEIFIAKNRIILQPTRATSKTWTWTLEPEPEKPGP